MREVAALERARILREQRRRVVRPDRARELPGQGPGALLEEQDPAADAAHVLRDGEAERDRHRVLAVRAAGLRRLRLAFRERDEPRREQPEPREHHLLDRFAVPPGVRGVDDVHRRRTEMHEAPRVGRDLRADHVDERAHVVTDARLLGVDRGGADPLGCRGDRVGGGPWRDALVRQGPRERRLGLRLRAHPSLLR